MIAGSALLVANDATLKHLSHAYPVGQVICLRQAATLLMVVPYVMMVTGWAAARVHQWPGQIFRGLLLVASTGFMVTALSLLPLTTVTAITFLSPIFVVLLSIPLLGERVGARRWAAVLMGFAGVLMIVQPGTVSFEWALLLPVVTALSTGLREVLTRQLSHTETSISILLCTTVIVFLAGLATAPFGWKAVDAESVYLFLFAGVCNAGAQFLMIEALRMGEASLVAPFRYSAFIWAILFGYLFFAELPGLWVLLGVGLIALGGWYSVRSEHGVRRARTPRSA